jgi:hypothetical protein
LKSFNKQQSSASDFIIRVKSDFGCAFEGSIEHIQSGQVSEFNDFLQLIMLAQKKLDQNLYPQSDRELRKFSGNE